MWIVYVIQQTTTREIYFGVTKDLTERLRVHNVGGQAATRRKEGAWVLIYAEAYRSREDALERERKLKHHGSGKHELLKRLRRSLV